MLVSIAEEIDATKTAYNEIYSGDYHDEALEYLLRFENPLEVVRDIWMSEICHSDRREEMAHVLWTIHNYQSAEQDYDLDPGWQPDQEQQIEPGISV